MEAVLTAVHDAVLDYGAKELAAKITGISHTALLNNANPHDDTHRMSLPLFLQVLAHTGDSRPLQALANALGFDLVARELPAARDLDTAMASMHKEVADVTLVAFEVLAAPHVNQLLLKKTEREISEAIASLQTLLESVKAA